MITKANKKLNRRSVLTAASMTGLAAAGATLTSAKSGKQQPTKAGIQKTYLLVHGAWHGGWCWRDAAAHLRERGHKVFTPTLTGLAERQHLLSAEIGLETHIQDVASLVEYYDLNNIVLVGHSYGGMVVTGVADQLKDRIDHIHYLDAALPGDGENMISQGPPRTGDQLAGIEQGLRALAPDGVAMQAFPPEILGIPKDHPGYEWVADKLTPHPLKTWLDPIKLENGGSEGLKRTYIHCNNPVLPNSSFAWHAEQVQKDVSWKYHSLGTGHDAMITAPAELVKILDIKKPRHPTGRRGFCDENSLISNARSALHRNAVRDGGRR